jgi:hypothetical protein
LWLLPLCWLLLLLLLPLLPAPPRPDHGEEDTLGGAVFLVRTYACFIRTEWICSFSVHRHIIYSFLLSNHYPHDLKGSNEEKYVL